MPVKLIIPVIIKTVFIVFVIGILQAELEYGHFLLSM